MALLQGVVERRLLEVNLARFPKTLLAFLFLAGKKTQIVNFCVTTIILNKEEHVANSPSMDMILLRSLTLVRTQ